MVLVTHHVEEIPAHFTHLLMLKHGKQVAAGPLNSTLTDESLTETFEMPLRIIEIDDRRFAITSR